MERVDESPLGDAGVGPHVNTHLRKPVGIPVHRRRAAGGQHEGELLRDKHARLHVGSEQSQSLSPRHHTPTAAMMSDHLTLTLAPPPAETIFTSIASNSSHRTESCLPPSLSLLTVRCAFLQQQGEKTAGPPPPHPPAPSPLPSFLPPPSPLLLVFRVT